MNKNDGDIGMFYERYCQLAKKLSKTPSGILQEFGMSKGNLSSWRNGGSPSVDVLNKLASYFSVSVDYLLGNTDDPTIKNEPAPNERLIREIANILVKLGIVKEGIPLSPEEQKRLLDYVNLQLDVYQKLRQ